MKKIMIRVDLPDLKTRLLKKFLWLGPAVNQITARIEVQFWAMVTYWMSESRLVQTWVVQAYNLKDRLSAQRAKFLRKALIWAGAGWLAGLWIGYLGF